VSVWVALALAAGFGLAIAAVQSPASLRRLRVPGGAVRPPEALAGILAGVVVAVWTRLPAAALGVGILAAMAVGTLRADQAERRRLRLRQGLAEVAGRLHDVEAGGQGLAQGIGVVTDTGPAELAAQLAMLRSVSRGSGVEEGLRAFGESVEDPLFRVFAASVAGAYRSGGALQPILSALAETTARRASTEQEIRARVGGLRLAASVVVAITVGLVLYVTAVDPGYLSAYRSGMGQLVMAGGFGGLVGCYWLMLRLGSTPGGSL